MPRRLHPLARDALQQAQAEHGIKVDLVEDFDHVVQINDLAERSAGWDPEIGIARVADIPLVLGDASFFRPSTGAQLWLEYCPQRWWSQEDVIQDIAVLYAMERGRDEATVAPLFNVEEAERTLHTYAKKLGRRTRLSHAAIMEAVNRYLADDESRSLTAHLTRRPERADSKPLDVWDFLAVMSEITGQPPSHWFWKESANTLMKVYEKWLHAEFDKARDPKSGAMDGNDPRTRAFWQFREAVIAFVKMKQGEPVDE